MTRMREALEVLERRRRERPESFGGGVALAEPPSVQFERPTLPLAPPPPRLQTPPPLRSLPRRTHAFEICTLPLASRLDDSYLDMARRISEQGARNYCNVTMFTAVDHWADSTFSIVHLMQAISLQTAGDVLLVDGDLRRGGLSQRVWPGGGGLIEAMQGTAQWPEIIHPTTAPRIDFVSRGNGPIPTLERSEFGWGALRPKYRVVLIGVAPATEPETAWLAARCDGVYLVVSRSKTRRSEASAAVNSLRSGGASVLGCTVADD